jgi:hypothetical protein
MVEFEFKALNYLTPVLVDGEDYFLNEEEIAHVEKFLSELRTEFGSGIVSVKQDEPDNFGKCRVTGLAGFLTEFVYTVIPKKS